MRTARLVLMAVLGLTACGRANPARQATVTQVTGGVPARGATAIRRYGCGACHTVPGVPGATSLVGPPLTNVAARAYVGGVITNTPEHMMQWIMSPQSVDPLTAMPNLGVNARDARDITSYLYRLR